MPECHNCGSHVTADFARVFGNNQNEVVRCRTCLEGNDDSLITHLMAGAAAKEEYEINHMGGRGI